MTPLERFNALTKRQQDEILDKHRNWNVDHIEWWDGVYDVFRSDMDAIGIEVDKMYFSGFWSQGDGACFEGGIYSWGDFLKSVGKRGAVSGSFVLKAHEMNALNTAMELHDAQMEVVTLKDMDKAIAIVQEEYRLKKMTPILEKT